MHGRELGDLAIGDPSHSLITRPMRMHVTSSCKRMRGHVREFCWRHELVVVFCAVMLVGDRRSVVTHAGSTSPRAGA